MGRGDQCAQQAPDSQGGGGEPRGRLWAVTSPLHKSETTRKNNLHDLWRGDEGLEGRGLMTKPVLRLRPIAARQTNHGPWPWPYWDGMLWPARSRRSR